MSITDSLETAPRPALELAGLVKRFGETTAVDHLDLEVPGGSFFGLVGPNGAGKTTTLSMAVQHLTHTGPNTITVMAVDAAGNRSAPSTGPSTTNVVTGFPC